MLRERLREALHAYAATLDNDPVSKAQVESAMRVLWLEAKPSNPNTEDQRFWILDQDDAPAGMAAIVDENAGGIIGYVNDDREAMVIRILNEADAQGRA